MPEFNPVPFNEEIVVAQHDPAWEERFQAQKALLHEQVGEVVAAIEHFGSTSVPNLIAKPVIGVLMGVETWPPEAYLIETLQQEDWLYFGQMGRRERHYLRRRDGQHFNIHIVQFEGEVWNDNLLFRDYLRSHADEVESYAEIKRQAFELGAGELDGYSSHKYSMMRAIQKRAHEWEACGRDDSKVPAYRKEQERIKAERKAERQEQIKALQARQIKEQQEEQEQEAEGSWTKWRARGKQQHKPYSCVSCKGPILAQEKYHSTHVGLVHGHGGWSDLNTCPFVGTSTPGAPFKDQTPLDEKSATVPALQRRNGWNKPMTCAECNQPIMTDESWHYAEAGSIHGKGSYPQSGTCTQEQATQASQEIPAKDRKREREPLQTPGKPLFGCAECDRLVMEGDPHHYTPIGAVHGQGRYGETGTCPGANEVAAIDEVDSEALHPHSPQQSPHLSAAWRALLAGHDPDQASE